MSLPTLIEVPVDEIASGPQVRAERFDLDHIARMRPFLADLPPITIRQGPKGWELVDGAHRLSARRFEMVEHPDDKSLRTVRCEVVELDEMQALEAAVVANINHGLPLSAGERKTNARRLLEGTDWSDRRIATCCGLSPTTVGTLRPPKPSNPGVQSGHLDSGRAAADGKAYPSDPKAQRAAIRAAIEADPDAKAGEIAEQLGCSAMTVLSVRREMDKLSGEAGGPTAPGAGTADPVENGSTGEPPAPVDPSPSRPPLTAVPATSTAPAVGDLITTWPVPGEWVKHPSITSNDARDAARILDRRIPRENEPAAGVAAAIPAELRRGASAAAREAAGWFLEIAHALDNPNPMEVVR